MHAPFRPHESGDPARPAASFAPPLSERSGAEQEATRQSKTIKGRLIVGKRGSLMITLDPAHLGLDTQDVRLSGRDRSAMRLFSPKREAHITLSGFNSELQASLHDPTRSERLEHLITQLNGENGIQVTFDPASPLRRIEKVYRGSCSDGKSFEEYREALIREVSCEKIERIITTVGEFLGVPLPLPYLFVTLYSSGSGHNIAVPTREALHALNPCDLRVEEIARAKVSGTDQREKIGAFVAMVARMREKSCPEVNGIKIGPSAQLGELVLAALVAPDPIERLTQAIEQPAVAAALHKILALRAVPYPQKHGLERSALEHTLHVVAEASKLCIERSLTQESTKAVMLAALLHDLGRGERGITQYKPDGSGGTRVVCRGYESAGGRPVLEVLRALDLLDYEPAVSGFVRHQAALLARYEEVLRGGMTRERCIERTESFLRNEYHDIDPEVFLVCTIANVRSAGAIASNAAIERDVYGLTEIFEEARRRLTSDNS